MKGLGRGETLEGNTRALDYDVMIFDVDVLTPVATLCRGGDQVLSVHQRPCHADQSQSCWFLSSAGALDHLVNLVKLAYDETSVARVMGRGALRVSHGIGRRGRNFSKVGTFLEDTVAFVNSLL